MSAIKNQIRGFIVDSFLLSERAARFADSDSLIENDIVDSTGFLELVGFLEQTYGIRIDDLEMVPENLETLDRIAAFVDRKRASA
jgi:acyl carrier protein